MRQLTTIIALISFAFVSLATMAHGTRMVAGGASYSYTMAAMTGHDGHGKAVSQPKDHCGTSTVCDDEADLCAAFCAKLTSFVLVGKAGSGSVAASVAPWDSARVSRPEGRVPSLNDRPPKLLLI